jgi:predicted RNase H-like HicB family nuclease
MKKGDKYVKLVEWSEEDGCFIGSCPELLFGDCHGADAKKVFADLCKIWRLLLNSVIAYCHEVSEVP